MPLMWLFFVFFKSGFNGVLWCCLHIMLKRSKVQLTKKVTLTLSVKRALQRIHKAAGLTVPNRSMVLPGTIPETPISSEWSRWLEWPPGVVPTAGRTSTGGFVNSAVKPRWFIRPICYTILRYIPCIGIDIDATWSPDIAHEHVRVTPVNPWHDDHPQVLVRPVQVIGDPVYCYTYMLNWTEWKILG